MGCKCRDGCSHETECGKAAREELRDRIAIAAMQGFYVSKNDFEQFAKRNGENPADVYARFAYKQADAMLKARDA